MAAKKKDKAVATIRITVQVFVDGQLQERKETEKPFDLAALVLGSGERVSELLEAEEIEEPSQEPKDPAAAGGKPPEAGL